MASLLDDKDKVVEKIILKSKKSKDEIEKLITEKKTKFSGLLTDTGAAFMVAKDLGVELNLEKNISEKTSISQLEDGLNNVDVSVQIKQIFAPKSFQKGGKKGKLVNLIVADDSGETRLTLWNKDVAKLNELKLEKGDLILLKNCYVTAFQEKPQLNLGYNGQIIVEKKGESQLTKLKELKKELNDVDVVGRVIRVYPKRTFEKEERKGEVLNFELADDTAQVRATAWNDLVKTVEKLKAGAIIKIEGAYTKEGLQGLELHLGFKSRVLREPEVNFKLPPLEDFGRKLDKARVADLKQGDSYKELNGMIVSIARLPGSFKVCPKCRKKAERFEDKFVCHDCGEVEPETNIVFSFDLDDGSAVIRCVSFGPQAETLLGQEKEKIFQQMQDTEEKFMDKLNGELVGRQIIVAGQAKKNAVSDELEFTVREVVKVGDIKTEHLEEAMEEVQVDKADFSQ
jgi:replication factor A1